MFSSSHVISAQHVHQHIIAIHCVRSQGKVGGTWLSIGMLTSIACMNKFYCLLLIDVSASFQFSSTGDLVSQLFSASAALPAPASLILFPEIRKKINTVRSRACGNTQQCTTSRSDPLISLSLSRLRLGLAWARLGTRIC